MPDPEPGLASRRGGALRSCSGPKYSHRTALFFLSFLLCWAEVGDSPQTDAAQPASAIRISTTLRNPQFNCVLATGHRGAPRHAPENTLPSLAKAIELGASIVEIDVRATHDGHFVIFHDDKVARLTGQPGTIEERMLVEVMELEIRMAEFPGFPPLKILTLEEAITFLKSRAIVYLDHKTGPVARLAQEVVRLDALDHAYLVVRTPQAAGEARQAAPGLHLMAAITEEEPAERMEAFLAARPTLFELPRRHLTPEVVERLQRLGIRIFTNALGAEVESPHTTFQTLLYRGADVIQTDYLELLVPYLRAFNARHQDRRGETSGAGQSSCLPSLVPAMPEQ